MSCFLEDLMNKDKIYNILMLIVVIALSFLMGLKLATYVFADDFLTGYLLLILMIIVAVVLQTILHEAGHLVFGLLTGYRFLSFRVMSFIWLKDEGKIRFKRYMLPGTLGQCLMAPPPYSDRFPYVLYNLGGALMNLIVSAVFFVLYMFIQQRIVKGACLAMVFYGVISALANGVPLRTRYVNNDGMNIVEAARDPDAKRAFWQQLKINELLTQGVRPRDMPFELFMYPEGKVTSSTLVAGIKIMNESRAMDSGDYQHAYELIMQLLSQGEKLGGLYRYVLINDKEYLDCMYNRYAPLNDPGYIKYRKQMLGRSISTIRTEIAIAKTTGDFARINGLLSQFEAAAAKYPYRRELEGERELVRLVVG